MNQRYCCYVSYIGKKYYGMQIQNYTTNTIQYKIEKALKSLYGQEIKISYAGRTDSGVNAYKQVIHFDANDKFSENTIIRALNFYIMQEDINIDKVIKVNSQFHSRFSAKQRIYCYKIINNDSFVKNIFFKNTHWYVRNKIDLKILEHQSNKIIGKNDFSLFRKSECQAKNTIITLDDITIKQRQINPIYGNFDNKYQEILIFIKAKSFLHGMVRFIVGTLIHISTKAQNIEIKDIINSNRASARGPAAPAHGLYLYDVIY